MEKYLGTFASITENIDKGTIGLDKKIKEIMAVAKKPCIMGMNSAMAAIIKFKHGKVTKLLTNFESWLGLIPAHQQKPENI